MIADVSIEKSSYYFMMRVGLPVGWSGAGYPFVSGYDTAASVSLLGLWLGGDAMSKAQAQKHRAVSNETVTTSSHQEQSWWFTVLRFRMIKFIKRISVIALMWLTFSIIAALMLPYGIGVEISQRTGVAVGFVSAFAIHPLLGGLLSFGMPFGADGADSISVPAKLLMAASSVLLSWLAAMMVLQKGYAYSKVTSFLKNETERNRKIILMGAVIISFFSIFSTLNEVIQALVPSYFRTGSLVFNENMPVLLIRVFLIQLCVGFFLTIFVLIFKGVVDPLSYVFVRKDGTKRFGGRDEA